MPNTAMTTEEKYARLLDVPESDARFTYRTGPGLREGIGSWGWSDLLGLFLEGAGGLRVEVTRVGESAPCWSGLTEDLPWEEPA